MNNDLISRSELKKAIKNLYNETLDGIVKFGIEKAYKEIENAPIVDLWEMRQEATENALKKAEVLYKRPQGDCENCDFRKFTEKFVDNVVDLMNENGITSIEQLDEILRGGKEE